MRRYLTNSEITAALNRGKSVEQFLGGYTAYGDPAIRYAVVRLEDEDVMAILYGYFEPSHSGFYDVGEFRPIEPDNDPEDYYFSSFEEAIAHLETKHGAIADKFVNQGLVDEEYRDY